MSVLPVPAKMYFDDFSFDLLEYTVKRNSAPVSILNGLSNKDEDGKHISFLLSDNPDLKAGDILTCGNKSFVVNSIDYDTYNGKQEIIKAYY